MKSSRETKEKRGNEGSEEKFDDALRVMASKMLKQGMLPKDATGFSDSSLENIYAQAYRLYNSGKYGEAAHLFRILIILNAMETKYLLGLAACYHMLKEYYNAIQTYTLCSALDPQNPIPHYHSSDCFIQMKDYLSAMICLELTIERAGDKPEFSKMKERAQMSLESLKQQISTVPIDEETPMKREVAERGDLDLF